ncbi:MAG: hypothetical protein KBT53_02630 [Porticoccus sp.]|nr:hypothetical protein [Porticoccus sp.]MBQ0807120.1 hypothetical protein [Porticoccus sp.]
MTKHLSIPLLLALCLSGTGYAGSHTPEPSTHQLAPTAAEVATSVLFGAAEQQVLSEYLHSRDGRYSRDQGWDDDTHHGSGNDDRQNGKSGNKHKQKSLPPGLRKKLERGGELPPGWQKKVARGEVLDENVYLNHTRSLPEEILRRLPTDPLGTSIKQIDDRIVRVMDDTRTILDVFYLLNPQQ